LGPATIDDYGGGGDYGKSNSIPLVLCASALPCARHRSSCHHAMPSHLLVAASPPSLYAGKGLGVSDSRVNEFGGNQGFGLRKQLPISLIFAYFFKQYKPN